MKVNHIYIVSILTIFTIQLSNAQTALEFDGIDDYVYISYNPSYTPDSSLTIEAWVKQDTVQYWPAFISYFKEGTDTLWSGYWLGGNDMGQVSLFIGSDTSISTGYWLVSNNHIIDGNWHHIAGVINPDSAKLYVDGFLEASLHIPNAYYSPSGLWLGTDQFGYVFNGIIDEVRIWDIAKSSQEINNLKDSCLSGSENNLIAYFPMEDGVGSSIVSDHSTNNNNGTQFYMNQDSSWVSGYTCLYDPPVGYFEIINDNLHIYPNPFNEILNIQLNEFEDNSVLIEVFKTNGQIAINSTEYAKTDAISIDFSMLPAGMYFIHIRSNWKVSKHKVIKF